MLARAPLARVAFALALAAGCSSSGNTSPDADAAADVRPDADAATEASVEVRPEGGSGDLAADRDASPEAGGMDAKPDADASPADAADAKDGGDADAPDTAEAPVERPDVDAATLCMRTSTALTLPATVTGTLSGTGNNVLVSCDGVTGTPGGDAFFKVELTEFTILELGVTSKADTVIAVRPNCSSETEISCSRRALDDNAPSPGGFDGGFGGFGGFAGFGGPAFDAGFDASSGAGGFTGTADAAASDGAAEVVPEGDTRGLRVRLAPGTYTVIVDAVEQGVSAPFTLTARAVSAAPNAVCTAPTVVPSQSTLRGQLDLAGAPQTGCSGATASTLFYAVGVPAGQRVTARVQPLGGDHAWMPRIEAFTTCGMGACLAQGHSAAGATQQLDWTNNGSTWRLVTLAISSDSVVRGAQFDLSVSVTDLLATCSRPTPLKDGASLFAQDISVAPPAGVQTCGIFNDHAFYYSATLLPQQQLTVLAVGTASQSPFSSPVTVGLRSSCEQSSCLPANGNGGPFVNTSDQTVTVLIEISPSGNTFDTRFDLHVSMPPPPPGINVTPQAGLITSEAGKTATFTIALASPPLKPVSIALSSDTPSEGTVSPASVSFDDKNWSQPQTVTVTGVDDQANDGSRRYKIVTAAATSADSRYGNMNPPDVSVTNLDDDPGLFIEGADDLMTSESGASVTFTVRLNRKPSSTVKVPLSSSDVGEGTVSTAELIFQPSNWDVAQTVTVKGADDVETDGTQPFSVVIGALVSSDATYGGLDPADLPAHNRDDDLKAVAVKVLTIASCNSASHDMMAVDSFGTIYIALFCDGQLQVMTSADGGQTFTGPTVIPGSTDLGGEFMIAGGPGGVAYLVYEVGGQGLMFTRTTDAGLTWSPRKLLTADGGSARIAASGDAVAVVAASPNFQGGILVRSFDGGRTFAGPQLIDGTNLAVAISADHQTFWVPDVQFGGKLRRSTDGGQTFTSVGQVELSFGPFAFGPQHVFVSTGGGLRVYPLDDPSMAVDISGTSSSGQTFATAVDDAETTTLLNLSTDGNHAEAVRVTIGGTISAAKTVGPRADVAWAVPLSRKAVAFLLHTGSLPLFAVTTF